MDRTIRLVIPGDPRGKERPRFAVGRAYTPKKTSEYESIVRQAYLYDYPYMLFAEDEPLMMTIFAFYAIPKSASRKLKQAMIAGEVLPAKKPDADNVAKIIADSLNGVAFHDDAQIVYLSVLKKYAESPCVVVHIDRLKKQEMQK